MSDVMMSRGTCCTCCLTHRSSCAQQKKKVKCRDGGGVSRYCFYCCCLRTCTALSRWSLCPCFHLTMFSNSRLPSYHPLYFVFPISPPVAMPISLFLSVLGKTAFPGWSISFYTFLKHSVLIVWPLTPPKLNVLYSILPAGTNPSSS